MRRQGDRAVEYQAIDVDTEVRAFESIAGFSYAEGRDLERQRAAWRRWAQSQM